MGKQIEVMAELLALSVQQNGSDNNPFISLKTEDGKKVSFYVSRGYYNNAVKENTLAAGMKGKLVYSKGLFGSKFVSFTPQ